MNRVKSSRADRSIHYHESVWVAIMSTTRIKLRANFREAFSALDGSKAKGMNGSDVRDRVNLNHNLKSPLREIRTAGSVRVLPLKGER